MFLPGDLIFIGTLLIVDAVAFVTAARRPSRTRVLAAIVGTTFVGLLLAGGMQLGLFHLLRLHTFVVFVHGPFVLLLSGWVLRRVAARTAGASVLGAVLVLAVAADAFLVEPHWLEVREVRLSSPKLTRPLRIAVVADLQTDRVGAYERDVLSRVVEARPDLILMPGDYVQEFDRERREAQVQALRELIREVGFDAPLGAYATRGNVEPRVWPGFFDGVPVTALPQTRSFDVGEIRITGLDLDDSFDTSMRVEGSERFHIAFGHAPDFALGNIDADLLVAGHTHGGQVRLPLLGPVITLSQVPRAWAAGVTRLHGGRTLVVSRGIGMERMHAPRMRFLCRPELVLIDVLPGD